MMLGTTSATPKVRSAVRQLPPVSQATTTEMTAYETKIKPIAPATGPDKNACRREYHRNTQTQVSPTPVMPQ